VERLDRKDHPTKRFFTFANTVATSTLDRTSAQRPWLDRRALPDRHRTSPNDVILHVRLHDPDISLQQESVGVMGVNLLHACCFLHHDPQEIMTALYDNVSRHVVEVDMIQMNGPDFARWTTAC
jgi:hypothetical protein